VNSGPALGTVLKRAAVVQNPVRSYETTDTYWHRYLPFLPRGSGRSVIPTEAWWAWEGAQVHLDRHVASDAKGTVILLHGAGGYGRILAPFAEWLREGGYDCICPDLPGYGLTLCEPRHVDHSQWVRCVTTLVEIERERTGRPVFLFGLSLGGFLGYLVASRSPHVAGLAATTLADPRERSVRQAFVRFAALEWTLPLLPAFAAVAPDLRLPVRWLSRMSSIANDPALVEIFLADKLGAGSKISLSFARSLLAPDFVTEPECFHGCPVLLAHPAADTWTAAELSKAFLSRLGVSTAYVALENCGHYPVEEPGATELREALLEFLDRLS
jgi:alpha-beta hydrolase superfamily lysophospholipase